jgi:response regulator RpfG family c-di-GMP phosphodiesterase
MPHFKAERALEIKREKKIDVPFILVSGFVDKKLANEMIQKGASKYVDKSMIAELLPVVHGLFELSDRTDNLIDMWAYALEQRDWETAGHTKRVTDLTVQLARFMHISETDIVHMERGARLHDVGKIWISDSILLKRRELTPGERLEMQRHPEIASDLLKRVPFLIKGAVEIPYCHHEKFDGTGYPRQLKGEQIPISARIFSIIDVYDAVTSARPYRAETWEHERALTYIESEKGRSFDPAVVDMFLEMMKGFDA